MKTTRRTIGQPFIRLGNLNTLIVAATLVTLAASAARASDPNGIYAFVDRVVYEPSEAAPERIQVWGGFALAKAGGNGNEYQNAERGFLYFKLRVGDEAICKKEWADLKSVAGTRQIVAFGSRHEQPDLKVRKPDAKVENPDVYPKSWGIVKSQMRDYAPINQLEKLMGKAPDTKAPAAKEAPAAKAESPASAAPKAGGN